VAWAKAFPRSEVKSKEGTDFDMGKAWIENGGTVAAGAEANIAKLAEAASSYGFIDIKSDPDGTCAMRFSSCVTATRNSCPSLALHRCGITKRFLTGMRLTSPNRPGAPPVRQTSADPSRDGTALINYTGPTDLPAIFHGGLIDGTVRRT